MHDSAVAARPPVTVLIATADRPGPLAQALASVCALTYSRLQIIVVSQGADAESATLLAAAAAEDRRLVPLRLEEHGKAHALNAGLAVATGEIIVLTDDDCTVTANWVDRIVDTFDAHQDVDVIFGAVVAAPHDAHHQFVPVFMPAGQRLLRGRFRRAHRCGMGANMAIRRRVLDEVGGFDEAMGPGGPLRSGDDWELAYRVLRAGKTILQDPGIAVAHWGTRSIGDGTARRLIGNNFFGMGAGYARHAHRGDAAAAAWMVEGVAERAATVMARVITAHRPFGAYALIQFVAGIIAGWTFGAFL